MGKIPGMRVAMMATGGVVLWLAVACDLTPEPVVADSDYGLIGRCPKSTYPCGNGCMPLSAACCDDGTRRTSNYCTNSAGGGCRPNPNNDCKAPAPSGDLSERPPSEFCCASTLSAKPEGSFDCPAGQHHCTGPSCVPIEQPCCAKGSLAADCQSAADSTGCPSRTGVRCGVTAGFCDWCPSGSCCASDPLAENGKKCLPATGVCTGTTGSGSTTSSGSPGTCKLVWDCKTSTQCAQVYGAPTGSADEPDKATCEEVCKAQGACTCQGCT
jgi:hypothetical protein